MECNVKVFRYICPHYVAISRFVQVYARDINEETIIGLYEKSEKADIYTYIPGGIALII
jgi:hypothetical protein